jgi:hypothetical protein
MVPSETSGEHMKMISADRSSSQGRDIGRIAALAALAIACVACPDVGSREPARAGRQSAGPPALPAPPASPPESARTTAPARPRDEDPATDIAATYRAVHPMQHDALGWYGLEAEAAVPAWASGSGAELARDDDLLTAWTCEQAEDDAPCALSLSFPQEAEVSLVRVFASQGLTKLEHRSLPRVRDVKLHTGHGWVRATLQDFWSHQYVQLTPPISTSGLTLEVESAYPGIGSGRVAIAEVEVFGRSGAKRSPLELDPRRAVVRGSPSIWVFEWGGGSGTSQAGPQWVEQLADDLTVRRVLPGAALLGHPGDRYFLVPYVARTGCNMSALTFDVEGHYMLVDRERRAFYTIEGLGEVGGSVWRARAGSGFAAVPPWLDLEADSDEHNLDVSVLETATDEPRTRRVKAAVDDAHAPATYESALKRLGYEPARADEAAVSCSKLSLAAARALVPTASMPVHARFQERCGEWRRCDIGDGLQLVVLFAGDASWAGLLGSGGALLGSIRYGYTDSQVRTRRVPGGPLLLETTLGLHRLDADHPLELAFPNAAFDATALQICQVFDDEDDDECSWTEPLTDP